MWKLHNLPTDLKEGIFPSGFPCGEIIL